MIVLIKMSKIEDFYDVVYPFYIVSKILGYSVYPLKETSSTKLFWKYLLLNLFYFMCVVIIEICLMFHYFKRQSDHVLITNSYVTNLASLVLMVMTLINYFVTLAMNLFFQKNIRNLIAVIANTDKYLKNLGIHINHKLHYNFVIFYLVATLLQAIVVISVSQTFLDYFKIDMNSLEMIMAYTISTISYTTYIGHMILALVAIYVRFRALNVFIEKNFISQEIIVMAKSLKFVTLLGKNEENQTEIVRKIAIIHDKLNDIVVQVNFCFSIQVRIFKLLLY